ncbi:hypothetical protein IK146_03165 [Candidatus Saccharibacteria bacterium]|nr:hypothetical protein [Candidatus Saccharibacteria bacterium]
MKAALIVLGTIAVAVIAWFSAKWFLYNGWYKRKSGVYAKRNLIIGCIAAVVALIAVAELVVELASCKRATFVTDRAIQLDTIKIDTQTETICWLETTGEEKSASIYSVGISFGAEEPWLHEEITEDRSKFAYYLFGLKEVRSDPTLNTKYTFHLPESLKGLVSNSFE